jgi:heavy metal sensor kinase
VTLTTRLSLFSLATLVLVLLGFSATLYLLARAHLYGQAEERVDAALTTLAAAAEVGPEGVEWEPGERRSALRLLPSGDALVWLVSDDDGAVVDQSAQTAAGLLAEASHHLRTSQQQFGTLNWNGQAWQFHQRRIQPEDQDKSGAAHSQPLQDGERKYSALTITAGVPLEPVQATLNRLAAALTGLSLGIWLVALVVGRLLCRRALLPVHQMAATVRDMDAEDLERRLPIVASGDELEDLTRAFNSLLDGLRESFERQHRFTGDASHQLRTPLAALLGQIEVALRRERPAEEYQRVLSSVHENAQQLRRILESLLFLTRADAEARLPDTQAIDLCDWLPAHLRTWSQHSRAADIILDASSSGPWRIEAQPILLGELVNILLENACKYSPPGSAITVRLAREKDDVLLSVEDHGCGIPEEDLPHVCEPFYRSDRSCREGIAGLGLGLAIAKRLADAFGARLSVASTVGTGSRFVLHFREAARPADSALQGQTVNPILAGSEQPA